MKNLMKSAAIAFLFIVSLTSMATVPTNDLVILDEGKSLFLSLESQLDGSTVKITDKTGNTLFFADMYDGKFSKKFNLEQLESGTYYFILDNPQASVVYTLNVKGENVEIIDKAEKASPSVFRKEGDKVLFTLADNDLKRVEIKITNSKDAVVFKESKRVDGSINKVFNFEMAAEDRYIIAIADGKNTYYHHVEVAN